MNFQIGDIVRNNYPGSPVQEREGTVIEIESTNIVRVNYNRHNYNNWSSSASDLTLVSRAGTTPEQEHIP